MTDVEAMAGEVLDLIEAGAGAQEFKRTVRHDDGTGETFRIDVTDADGRHFTAATVRQRGQDPRWESAPRRFARADRRGFADWLANGPS